MCVYYAAMLCELSHEIGLLYRGQVLDNTNVVVRAVEEKTERCKKIGDVVTQH